MYLILCSFISCLSSCVHHSSQETEISIIRVSGATLSQAQRFPPCLLPSLSCLCYFVICSVGFFFFKFLLSSHHHTAAARVPWTLWFKLLAALKALTELHRQLLRIFLFVKLAVKIEECMGSDIKLDKFAVNKQMYFKCISQKTTQN